MVVAHQRVYCWPRGYNSNFKVPVAAGEFEMPLLTRWFHSYWLTQSRKMLRHSVYLYRIHSCFNITVWGSLLSNRFLPVDNCAEPDSNNFYSAFSHYTCVSPWHDRGVWLIPEDHLHANSFTDIQSLSLYNLVLGSYFIICIEEINWFSSRVR